ncbi:unnamed protein product [Mesocestoides corti]|uniref:GCS light chain n=1 Tax=Mesocestoides corti TaxID=53468 RepID=A0A0R3UBK4_MESCO|nr:unnamed protein product [Mesocestoides corti]
MSEFPQAKEFFLHTSNILKWNNVQLIKNPFEENLQTLCIACDKHRDKIPESERSGVFVSAKLFLFTDDHDSIRQAINKTLNRLGLEDIETLIVTLSPELSQGAVVDHPTCLGSSWVRVPQSTAVSLLKVWPVLEEFVEANKVFRLGVTDMPVYEMETLCSSVKTPPKVNQVFIGSSYLLGEDLENFAKQHDIQLLTHHDSADMLPAEKLQAVLRSELSADDAAGWRPSWLMRYAEYYKYRMVVRSRGYTLFAERDLPAKCNGFCASPNDTTQP